MTQIRGTTLVSIIRLKINLKGSVKNSLHALYIYGGIPSGPILRFGFSLFIASDTSESERLFNVIIELPATVLRSLYSRSLDRRRTKNV